MIPPSSEIVKFSLISSQSSWNSSGVIPRHLDSLTQSSFTVFLLHMSASRSMYVPRAARGRCRVPTSQSPG